MKLSLIIPVRNGGTAFQHCLDALHAACVACHALAETEFIVVDDGSTDDSLARAKVAGARMLTTSGGRGPAAARNLGARHALGDILFFVDADVTLHADALLKAARAFQADPHLEACFGSYDDAPTAPNLLSQYKNLLHHYVHQHAHPQASTFWTGCGAIRAATFHALGGFDEITYQLPSIEDIDLGYRLRRRGGEILLLKDMQCAHLKHWTARSLLRSDIFERGIPWTQLLWRESRVRQTSEPLLATGDLLRPHDPALASRPFLLDLNLQTSNRLSVVLVALWVLALSAAIWLPMAGWLGAGLTLSLLLLNRQLYRFFYRKRGLWFLLAVIPWHWLYYLYNGISFTTGTLLYFWRGVRPVAADGRLQESVVSHQ